MTRQDATTLTAGQKIKYLGMKVTDPASGAVLLDSPAGEATVQRVQRGLSCGDYFSVILPDGRVAVVDFDGECDHRPGAKPALAFYSL